MDRTRCSRISSVIDPPERRLAWRNPFTGMSTTSCPRVPRGDAGRARGRAVAPRGTADSVSAGAVPPHGDRRRLRVMSDRVAVVGAGSWGTAVAGLVGASHPVSYGRVARACIVHHSCTGECDLSAGNRPARRALGNRRHSRRRWTGQASCSWRCPRTGFGPCSSDLRPFAVGVEAIVSLSKGIENGTNLRMSEVVGAGLARYAAGVLTGPESGPGGGRRAAGRQRGGAARRGTGAPACKISFTPAPFACTSGTDVVGCEIAGATKNVMAIAAGIRDGLGFGENTPGRAHHAGAGRVGTTRDRVGWPGADLRGSGRGRRPGGHCASPKSRNRTVGFRARPRPDARRDRQRHAAWWPRG